jgi:hypothetical protein
MPFKLAMMGMPAADFRASQVFEVLFRRQPELFGLRVIAGRFPVATIGAGV